MKKEQLLKKNFAVYELMSIEEAMRAITDNQRGAVFVINEDGVFQGIVSDGDIRRALISGATHMTPIGKIVNVNPVVLILGEENKAEGIFASSPEITLLPVLNKKNILVDIIMREKGKRK